MTRCYFCQYIPNLRLDAIDVYLSSALEMTNTTHMYCYLLSLDVDDVMCLIEPQHRSLAAQDLPVADGVQMAIWCGKNVCLGSKREYAMIEVGIMR